MLGINAQIKSQSGGGEGVGFAIPVDAVRRSLQELRAEGKVDYGYLGVQTLVLWPQLAESSASTCTRRAGPEDRGGSPAEDAKLRAGDDDIEFQGQRIRTGGDVIVAVNGQPLTPREDLAERSAQRTPATRWS